MVMKIQSAKLGEVEYSEQDLINFEHGLPGFPDEKQFILIPYHTDSPFVFLQSVGDPNISFLMTEPFTFFQDYEFELSDEIMGELGFNADNIPLVFNIVTIPDKLADITANLMAPVVINKRNRRAAQIILEKTVYTTKHKLFPHGIKQAERSD